MIEEFWSIQLVRWDLKREKIQVFHVMIQSSNHVQQKWNNQTETAYSLPILCSLEPSL